MLDCLKKYFNFLLAIITLAIVLIIILMFIPVNYTKVKNENYYGYLEDLYTEVENAKLSNDNSKDIDEIIERRLACYASSISYRKRIAECNPQYIADLVSFARENVRSNPLLGNFVINSGSCPVMFNVCRGTENKSTEECIKIENQCIELMMDKYWRGSNSSVFF
jgi:hypothetical protein